AALALNSPSTLLAITLAPNWAVESGDPETKIHVLQVARRGTILHRENEAALVVTFEDPALLSHRYERVFHTSEEPPPAGTAFTNEMFTATVLATEGPLVRSVRLDFPMPLEDAGYRFLAWEKGAYRRLAMPAVGETLRLPEPAPTVPWVP
ncbi:MAG TPA: hypothetical protein VIH35_01305, partial [Kiritimatiellia bacterium]